MSEISIHEAARIMGRLGGQVGGRSKSARKKLASAANGKLGGRRRQYPPCPKRYSGGQAHRFNKAGRCPCGFVRDQSPGVADGLA